MQGRFYLVLIKSEIKSETDKRWVFVVFFFNDTATTEIYTLSLHDALPIFETRRRESFPVEPFLSQWRPRPLSTARSEEHTSELQSQSNLVCRLLLEKKKKILPLTTDCTIRTLLFITYEHDLPTQPRRV